MSTTPRFTSAVPDEPPSLRTAYLHVPDLGRAVARADRAYWSSGLLDLRIKELARIRSARITDCNH